MKKAKRQAHFDEAFTAAVRVLSEGPTCRDYKDIAYEAVSRGFWETDHPNPETFMNQALSYNIRTNKKSLIARTKGGFPLKPGVKCRSGHYALKHRFDLPHQDSEVTKRIKLLEDNCFNLQLEIEKLKMIS